MSGTGRWTPGPWRKSRICRTRVSCRVQQLELILGERGTKRSKSRNGYGCGQVLEMYPSPLLFSQRIPSLGPASLLALSLTGTEQKPDRLSLLQKTEPGLALAKKELKEIWGSPGSFWRAVMPGQHSSCGLLVAELPAHGRST